MGLSVFFSWKCAKVFASRLYALYLILVFLFISNYLATYHFMDYLNRPFRRANVYLISTVARLFFEKPFTGNLGFRDYYWTYVALVFYFLIATAIALVWTVADKGEKSRQFFVCTWVFARYYLAAIFLGYGISKLFGDQFARPDLSSLIMPLGDHDVHTLFWEYMGASKSYQIFGGLLETIAGLLLLFRRTATIGCLVSFALLVNILMLDIAYDTFVKVRLVYFILITVFILIPDLKRLYRIFILKQNVSLAHVLPLIAHKKYKWMQYALKFCLIGLMLAVILRSHATVYRQYHYPSYGSIAGIYKVQEFYVNRQLRPRLDNDSVSWNKIAINNYFPILSIQLMNDSVTQYHFKADTLKKIIELSFGNDPGFKSVLHYKDLKTGEWLFEGTFKNDSIRFTSKKSRKVFNLEKRYGETIWDYDF